MHRNHRRKFNVARYNYQDSRYGFSLKGYRIEYNRKQRHRDQQRLRNEKYEALDIWLSPHDFCGQFF